MTDGSSESGNKVRSLDELRQLAIDAVRAADWDAAEGYDDFHARASAESWLRAYNHAAPAEQRLDINAIRQTHGQADPGDQSGKGV